MSDKPYGIMSLEELFNEARKFVPGHNNHAVIRAEIDIRVSQAQIDATRAQVKSARLQLYAVIAMFLAVVATIAAPLIARAISHCPS